MQQNKDLLGKATNQSLGDHRCKHCNNI